MKTIYLYLQVILSISFGIILVSSCTKNEVLQLNPENNHYFLYKGKPSILVGSTEHYGAVVNLGFDYVKYLDELKKDGLNLTRTFSGIYIEPMGAFNIEKNTLAPASDQLIIPFARSSEGGYARGGNKFDLTKWDEAYFKRLKDFVEQAKLRDIIVEINLFSSIYSEFQWKANPQNPVNNINNLPVVHFLEVQTLKHPEYVKIHEDLVKKIATKLNDFDNIYYEVCNEPYADNIPSDWQDHMLEILLLTESNLPKKHLVSNNITNQTTKIKELNKGYSIVNFHYAEPSAVSDNYHLNIPVGDNETGFEGTDNWAYRTEAWSFLLAGGALFNHLDYSFTAGYENGTFKYPNTQPGGGNPELRKQFGFMKSFIDNHDFLKMKPDSALIMNTGNEGLSVQVLSQPEKIYVAYLYKKWKNANENISVRWTGNFIVPQKGNYLFRSYSDDGIRLWVNNIELINNWTGHAVIKDSGSIQLNAGQIVPFKVDYYNGMAGGSLKITWQIPGGSENIIGETVTETPDNTFKGIKTEYFRGINFENYVSSEIESSINMQVNDLKVYGFTDSVRFQTQIKIELPAGKFKTEWIDTKAGIPVSTQEIDHAGGEKIISSPDLEYDILLCIIKMN